MTEKRKLRILLADDYALIRAGIKSFLAGESRFEVVGEVDNGEEAVTEAIRLKPDIVLMDVGMPRLDGVEAARRLRKIKPEIRILALSRHDEKERIHDILQAGARGYVLKDASPAELIGALEAVARGKTYFSPQASHTLIQEYVANYGRPKKSPVQELSVREREVLVLIAEGSSNKEIAARLFISVRTVETHREHIMRKLEIHNTAGLTKYAITQGLIRLKKS